MSITNRNTSQVDELFFKIYHAAKSGNKKALKTLLYDTNTNICIDILNQEGLHTPASLLAKEGDKEAVKLLLEFNANPNWIAYGYAMGSYVHEAELVRENYDADVNLIALGYAIGLNKKMVEEYLEKHQANINWITRGYTIAHAYQMVDEYRKKYQIDEVNIAQSYLIGKADLADIEAYFSKHPVNEYSLAETYAMIGDVEKISAIRKKLEADTHLTSEQKTRINNNIARGFAMGGYFEQVKDCYQRDSASLNAIITGLATSGHFDELESYSKLPDSRFNYIAQTLAYTNHLDEAERYHSMFEAKPFYIARGCALAGNVKNLQAICIRYELKPEDFAEALWNSNVFKNDPNQIIKILSHVTDKDFLINLANALNKYSLPKIDVVKLLDEVKTIKSYYNNYGMTFSQALAWHTPNVKIWLMEGRSLMKSGLLAYDMFLEVLCKTYPMSHPEAMALDAKIQAHYPEVSKEYRQFLTLSAQKKSAANDQKMPEQQQPGNLDNQKIYKKGSKHQLNLFFNEMKKTVAKNSKKIIKTFKK